MIHVPPQAIVFAIPEPINFGLSVDQIAAICKRWGFDYFSGEIYAFRDEAGTQIGLLTYDGHGIQWCVKRGSEGKVTEWPSHDEAVQILPRDLQIMLWGGDPSTMDMPEMWRPIHEPKEKA